MGNTHSTKRHKNLLHTVNMQVDDIDWFIPHSANLRMIESICEKSQIQYKNINERGIYGEYLFSHHSTRFKFSYKEGKLNNGDTLLLYGFGGGLTHLGLIVEWNLI